MTDVFLELVNRSISASFLVLAVLLVRPLLKQSPKWTLVLLWGIVAVRLLCPISLESALSLIPSAQTIPPTITMDTTPQIQSGIPAINAAVNPILSDSYAPVPGASANPLQIIFGICADLWSIGAAGMLLYSFLSYWRLRLRLRTAVRVEQNIFQSERVDSPFVLGLFRPRIYLPFHLDAEKQAFVIAHEKAHIRRKDHWWKPLGYLLLSLHWFNPVMWLAYWLLCRDIELACDEAVIRSLDNHQKADYSQALLWCSTQQRSRMLCPLAFGEVGVAQRVKSILHYKKPGFWICLISVVVCIVVAVCFLTNPNRDSFEIQFTVPAGSQDEYVYATEEILPKGNTITLSSGDNLPDTEFILEGLDSDLSYGPMYLTPGMPVTVTVEPGWYRVGINVQNPEGSKDYALSMHVTPVEVRICEYAPYFGNVQYRISQVLYENPSGSYSTRTELDLPTYFLGNEMTLSSILENQWVNLGTMEEVILTKENFDNLFVNRESTQWLDGANAWDIRRDNQQAWRLVYDEEELYYVLQQKDGSLLLASGYYDFAEADDPYSDDTTLKLLFQLETQTALPEASGWIDNTFSGGNQSITHPAFPDVRFSYDDTKVTATGRDGITQELFTGMPIHNVYFADLNGDGYPELCATVSFGSGLIDNRIIVYDYRNQTEFLLQDRGNHDYRLSLVDNHLLVTEYQYNSVQETDYGYLTMTHDAIQILSVPKELDLADLKAQLEQYRTDYIGNAVDVSKIAQLLPYPSRYQYDSIEIQSSQEPYVLTIYLTGQGATSDSFAQCDELLYEYIGNLDFIYYRNSRFGSILQSSARNPQEHGYYLTIGADNVFQILLSTSAGSSSCMNADGSAYPEGQQVWLEPLAGMRNIEGVTITAQDDRGNPVWTGEVAEEAVPYLPVGDWALVDGANQPCPLRTLVSIVVPSTEAELEGIVDNYLFLLQGEHTYRYQRTEMLSSDITPSIQLDTFVEKAEPRDITWEVYATREYPGNQVLYVVGDGIPYLYEHCPPKRCEDHALAEAKENGYVVVENGVCTSGLDAWEAFFETAQAGKSAQVQVAHYITLVANDPTTGQVRIAPELYEAIKEDYPSLTYYVISFDGETYTISSLDLTNPKEYAYLRYFPDLSPESSNPMSRYVLTNDNTATWDQLWQSMASSVLGAYIDHFTVLKAPQS